MMIDDLDMSEVLEGWIKKFTIKTIDKQSTDFEPDNEVAGRNQDCMIQVADKKKLNPEIVNWKLAYIMVHSPDNIDIGEFVEYQGEDYKVIDKNPYGDYGFIEVTGESTNRPLIQVTL